MIELVQTLKSHADHMHITCMLSLEVTCHMHPACPINTYTHKNVIMSVTDKQDKVDGIKYQLKIDL